MSQEPSSPLASEVGPVSVSAQQALCVYAEELANDRRVVVIGDVSQGIGERLLTLGARAVHVFDPRADRVAAAPEVRGLVVRELPAGDLDVREGAFDLALIPDLGGVDPGGDLLARLRRVLGRSGVALVGTRAEPSSEEALDYYELYDRVALQFSHVRMIAQASFTGVTIADLGVETAPEVSVDTQLAGEAAPAEHFFAVASQVEVRLAEYAIIQLPAPPPSAGQALLAADRPIDSGREAALAEAQLRASLFEAQVEELRGRLSQKSADQTQRVAELVSGLNEERARREEAEAFAAERSARLEKLERDATELRGALERERERSEALEADLGGRLAEIAGARDAEARAAALAEEVAALSEGHAGELGQLERLLRERATAIRELEHEVVRREQLVRELLGALEEGHAAEAPPAIDAQAAQRAVDLAELELANLRRELEERGESLRQATELAQALALANEELRARLDRVSMEVAREAGERGALQWRVSELEDQVARLEAEQTELTVTIPPPPLRGRLAPVPLPAPEPERLEEPVTTPASGQASGRLQALEEELDVLRQALAQEHEARKHAESGEELQKARAELARQAVLLEQLSRELDAKDRARTQGIHSVDTTEA